VLDLDDPASLTAAACRAADTDLLVNNAGSAFAEDESLLDGDEDTAPRVFETNYFGTLRVVRAFAPVLAANSGGSMLNVLSLAAWTPVPSAYAGSKAAAWSATNGLRVELAGQGTTVTGLPVGLIDTAMAARFELPKVSPQSVVEQAYDGVVAGAFEVLADDNTRWVKSLLSHSAEDFDNAISDLNNAITEAFAAHTS
jgi:NAD(P)-dependent dehydrogenase (short-subunit alcohol dehydrogenase family)